MAACHSKDIGAKFGTGTEYAHVVTSVGDVCCTNVLDWKLGGTADNAHVDIWGIKPVLYTNCVLGSSGVHLDAAWLEEEWLV